MEALSVTTPAANESPYSLADKVIKAGGIVGLIAVGTTAFLMWAFWAGQRDLAAAQEQTHSAVGDTKSAISQHVTDSEADRKIERQLQYAMCRSLAKLSKSEPELCEVGR